jgi:hypothetical protein
MRVATVRRGAAGASIVPRVVPGRVPRTESQRDRRFRRDVHTIHAIASGRRKACALLQRAIPARPRRVVEPTGRGARHLARRTNGVSRQLRPRGGCELPPTQRGPHRDRIRRSERARRLRERRHLRNRACVHARRDVGYLHSPNAASRFFRRRTRRASHRIRASHRARRASRGAISVGCVSTGRTVYVRQPGNAAPGNVEPLESRPPLHDAERDAPHSLRIRATARTTRRFEQRCDGQRDLYAHRCTGRLRVPRAPGDARVR